MEQTQDYKLLKQKYENLQQRDRYLEIINDFSIYLLNKYTVDEIACAITKKVIAKMNFVDCVVYLLDREENVLVQKAAHGSKNPTALEIKNPIRMPLGKGIAGAVAITGKSEIVNDTSIDPRYILDHRLHLSEITIPIIYENKVIGIIDSEHPEKNFYKEEHIKILTTVAAIAATKIMHAYTLESLQKHKKDLEKNVIELKRSNKELEQFAYAASHDLKEPIRTITSFLQLIERREINISDKSKSYLRFAINGSKRMQSLVSGLLDYSRVSGSSQKNEVVDIEKLLQNIQFNLLTSIQQTAAVINYSKLHNVFGNPTQIMQLFQNIISNAIKFRKNEIPPVIHISSHIKNDFVVFSIQDNGIGIAKPNIDTVFQLFKKLHSKEEYQGSGIGLALCKRIVEQHNGQIEIESKLGKGTCIHFSLPINDAHKT